METKIDASYGVIPVRWENNQWEVFLIHQLSKIGKNSYWVFPKGHREGNETATETALRELKEETDMTVVKLLRQPTFVVEYSFIFDGEEINKTVQFFIGVVADFNTKLDPVEVKEAGWYTLPKATERLDYDDTKNMFKEVRDFLKTKQEEL